MQVFKNSLIQDTDADDLQDSSPFTKREMRRNQIMGVLNAILERIERDSAATRRGAYRHMHLMKEAVRDLREEVDSVVPHPLEAVRTIENIDRDISFLLVNFGTQLINSDMRMAASVEIAETEISRLLDYFEMEIL